MSAPCRWILARQGQSVDLLAGDGLPLAGVEAESLQIPGACWFCGVTRVRDAAPDMPNTSAQPPGRR